MEESNESNVLASYSSFNVTPSGAIELRDVGAEKNDVKKEWRSYWVDDTSVDHCSMCEKHFRVRTRKHHCRLCGGVFCRDCTQNKTPIYCLDYQQPVRVCECCFRIICFKSLSYSPTLETQIHAIQGLERFLPKRVNNRQVVNHVIPALIVLGTSTSQIILLHIASAIHHITEDFDNHILLAEYGISETILHIIHSSIQQGRFLASLANSSDENMKESFIECRKTLALITKALSILSSSPEMQIQLASEGRLEKLLKLCYAPETAFTEEVHDLLLLSVLELSLHDKICVDLFSLEKGLELLLSLAVIEDDDALQITALSALLKLAQQDGNKRRAIIERGALGVACKLLSEDAKGPQRRTSMQLLEELVVEDMAHEPLVRQYKLVPILVHFLFVKLGLKEKNRTMIAKTLGLLGNRNEHRNIIISEISNILKESSLNISHAEAQQTLCALKSLAATEWLQQMLCQSKVVKDYIKNATGEHSSCAALVDWMN